MPKAAITENPAQVVVRRLGMQPYEQVWRNMQAYTDNRAETHTDELWVVEHPPVFTLGQAGKPEHLLDPGEIPVIPCDRGGQVTYHGPGQLVVYLLINLRHAHLGVRQLVTLIETSLVDLLRDYCIDAHARPEAPGVYIGEKKIAALGLRVRRGCSYHGLSLNVDMDLEPFQRINPCGYPGLEVTQLADLGAHENITEVADRLVCHLCRHLDYTFTESTDQPELILHELT